MRFTRYFKLKGHNQGTVDFVDIKLNGDVNLYVDPAALRHLKSDWGDSCTESVQDYFANVLDLIKRGDIAGSQSLLVRHEPNDVRLGSSQGLPKGRSFGEVKAKKVWEALSKSNAAKSGLLKDLEDAILLVDGVGPDLISDLTTDIIRPQLIAYTQEQCQNYGIPLSNNIPSGPLWDPQGKKWAAEYTELPTYRGKRIILVPKVIVRKRLHCDLEEYYSNYILDALIEEHKSANSALVHILKSPKRKGEKRVYKTELRHHLAENRKERREVTREVTERHTELLKRYRDKRRRDRSTPLSPSDLSKATGAARPDLKALLAKVKAVAAGRSAAGDYHDAVFQLLNALFWPDLHDPVKEQDVTGGRGYVDIVYTNSGYGGFFGWLRDHGYHCPYVFVECKNYVGSLGNTEFNQLASRLNFRRGNVGILVCREDSDKGKSHDLCKSRMTADTKYMLVLDDADLTQLVDDASKSLDPGVFPLLRERFKKLVMSE